MMLQQMIWMVTPSLFLTRLTNPQKDLHGGKQKCLAKSPRVHSLEENFIVNEAAKWNDCENPLLFENGMEAGSVQKLADAVLQVCKGRCAVFSRNADGSYKYAMGEKDGDLRQFTKDMNAALNGRGGGKPFFVQGSVQASEKEIRAFFEE